MSIRISDSSNMRWTTVVRSPVDNIVVRAVANGGVGADSVSVRVDKNARLWSVGPTLVINHSAIRMTDFSQPAVQIYIH